MSAVLLVLLCSLNRRDVLSGKKEIDERLNMVLYSFVIVANPFEACLAEKKKRKMSCGCSNCFISLNRTVVEANLRP